jgi:hypothetical protein
VRQKGRRPGHRTAVVCPCVLALPLACWQGESGCALCETPSCPPAVVTMFDSPTVWRDCIRDARGAGLVARWLLPWLIGMASLQPGGASGQTVAAPAPRIHVSADELDIGHLEFNRFAAAATVEVRNMGTAPLAIRKVRTSCLCVKADLGLSRLEPGQQTLLTLEADGSQLMAMDEAVFLYTNDPQQPVVKVRIVGTIGRPVQAEPVAFSLGLTHKSKVLTLTTSIVVRAVDRQPLGRLRVEPSAAFLDVQATRAAEDMYEIRVGFLPTLPIGRVQEMIRVHTEHPRQPTVDIPVFGYVTGDVTPGQVVDFGLVPEGQPAIATLRIPNAGTRDVEILAAEVRLEALPAGIPVPAEVDVAAMDRGFDVRVRVVEPPALSRLRGILRLHTSHPEETVVELPVLGATTARQPFAFDLTPEQDEKLRAVAVEALSRGDRVPAEDFFSRILGGVQDDRAAMLLLRIGSDLREDMSVRLRALEFLATLRTTEVVEPLRKLVTEDHFEFVRRFAMVALAQIAGTAAVPELLMAMEDDGAWVREDAATLLGALGDERAIRPLQRATRDPDEDARKAAQAALDTLMSRIKR